MFTHRKKLLPIIQMILLLTLLYLTHENPSDDQKKKNPQKNKDKHKRGKQQYVSATQNPKGIETGDSSSQEQQRQGRHHPVLAKLKKGKQVFKGMMIKLGGSMENINKFQSQGQSSQQTDPTGQTTRGRRLRGLFKLGANRPRSSSTTSLQNTGKSDGQGQSSPSPQSSQLAETGHPHGKKDGHKLKHGGWKVGKKKELKINQISGPIGPITHRGLQLLFQQTSGKQPQPTPQPQPTLQQQPPSFKPPPRTTQPIQEPDKDPGESKEPKALPILQLAYHKKAAPQPPERFHPSAGEHHKQLGPKTKVLKLFQPKGGHHKQHAKHQLSKTTVLGISPDQLPPPPPPPLQSVAEGMVDNQLYDFIPYSNQPQPPPPPLQSVAEGMVDNPIYDDFIPYSQQKHAEKTNPTVQKTKQDQQKDSNVQDPPEWIPQPPKPRVQVSQNSPPVPPVKPRKGHIRPTPAPRNIYKIIVPQDHQTGKQNSQNKQKVNQREQRAKKKHEDKKDGQNQQ